MSQETLSGAIKKWVVNDYFTPNIKAEVILDTLLTPYVDKMVNQHLGLHTVFVTKEMSIYEEKEQQDKQQDNRGPKIDYVLADKDTVYLVELKTTSGSIKKKQANRYITHCYGKDGKTFGEVFGDKLLQIMTESAQKAKIDIPTQQKEAALYAAFQQIVNIKDDAESYADTAKCFLKREHGAGTDKYLYTMGQLLDYLYDRSGTQKETIWDKPLRLIYLTPDGGRIIPKKSYQNNKQAWDTFYLDLLRPTEKGSISLNDFSSCFSDTDTKDDLAQLLEQILKDIY